MQRFDSIEKGALLFACLLIIFGSYSAIYPTEMRVSHAGSGRYQSLIGHDPQAEYVSRDKARFYGTLLVVFGMGLGWVVFYRPRK